MSNTMSNVIKDIANPLLYYGYLRNFGLFGVVICKCFIISLPSVGLQNNGTLFRVTQIRIKKALFQYTKDVQQIAQLYRDVAADTGKY